MKQNLDTKVEHMYKSLDTENKFLNPIWIWGHIDPIYLMDIPCSKDS